MTKEEALMSTGYTEKELMVIALQTAINSAKKWRDDAGEERDLAAWTHYEALMTAYELMRDELKLTAE